MKIAIDDLRDKVELILCARFGKEDGARIADILLWADMSGIAPMGVAKMTGTEPIQSVTPLHEVRIERDTKLSQRINAGANPAPLVSLQATEAAIEKAKAHGMAIVGVHNTFSSNLTQAYYVEMMAEAGLIGIAMARGTSSSTGFNVIDPIFGTNPIGFGFPTDDEPLIFDMTTAAMTWSGLVLAKARGDRLPEGVAIDSLGNPTTDPAAAMAGATLPFDGSYKGSGLGLIVEALAGPLVGAGYADPSMESEYGSLFIAIDPELLIDRAVFKASSSDLINRIRSARTKDGSGPVRLPGERARASRKQALESGFVEIDDTIAAELGWL